MSGGQDIATDPIKDRCAGSSEMVGDRQVLCVFVRAPVGQVVLPHLGANSWPWLRQQAMRHARLCSQRASDAHVIVAPGRIVPECYRFRNPPSLCHELEEDMP